MIITYLLFKNIQYSSWYFLINAFIKDKFK